jgi:nitrogenase molybdenum-iron protein alpha chain
MIIVVSCAGSRAWCGVGEGHGHISMVRRLRPVFRRTAELLHGEPGEPFGHAFTSDFQEKDIVFGGDKKLEKIMDEIQVLFPLNKGISVQSECPIGLIGDDIEAVSKKKSKEYDGKTIVPVRCEGFRGVSQSLGHHIANDAIRDWVFSRDGKDVKTEFVPGPYDVSIIGDYNIGGDAWSSRILLEEMGLRVVAQWSGDARWRLRHPELLASPLLPLDELSAGTWKRIHPWVEYNFFGPQDRRRCADREPLRRHHQGSAERVIAKCRRWSTR